MIKLLYWNPQALDRVKLQLARMRCIHFGHDWTLKTQRGYRTCLRCGVSEML